MKTNVIITALILLIGKLSEILNEIKNEIKELSDKLSDMENLYVTIESDIELARFELEMVVSTPKAWKLVTKYINSSEEELDNLEEKIEKMRNKKIKLQKKLRKTEEDLTDARLELAKIRRKKK